MTQFTADRPTTTPTTAPPSRSLLHWVGTNNPFYVLSAGLFLGGLWMSFGAQTREVETWALMSGLVAYTLLLAVTGCLLVRFARVWDDMRTVLLLIVLMFLATSVTFDEVLVSNPQRGFVCYLCGLLFTVLISEGVLRGIRLRLPAGFRVPYYLILALFFLYPLALSPLVGDPHNETLLWGLFGFSSVAGLVFLTLLPAIRRGPDYIRGNGSPWSWPLYPWVLFGLLALAVPARAFLLCYSMHLLIVVGADRDQLVFGPWFLTPFGWALAVLLLEIGLTPRRQSVLAVALALPAGLLVFTQLGHRADPIYQEFLDLLTARLGDPLSVALLGTVVFYAYAALRRVRLAIEALSAAFVAQAVVGVAGWQQGPFVLPAWVPLVAFASLQLGLGLWQRHCGRCLAGAAGLIVLLGLTLPEVPFARAILFHLALAVILVLGALFDDVVGQVLRVVGAVLVLGACAAGLFASFDPPRTLSPWVPAAWSLLLALLLGGYGWWLRQWVSVLIAGLVLGLWLCSAGLFSYLQLREVVAGLDYIALSLVVFAVAVLVSLAKAGVLPRGLLFGDGEDSPVGVVQEALAAPVEGTPALPLDAIQSPESAVTPAAAPGEVQPSEG
jgi:hypothetical protein